MRWLIAVAVSFAIAAPADAGVFKSRGKPDKPAAAPAKKPAAAKKAPAKQAAPRKAPVAKAPAKKGRSSVVASKGRPDDLTPDVKKKDEGGVSITEDVEDDVIIRDIDD